MPKFIVIFCLFLSFNLLLDSNFSLAEDLPVEKGFIEKAIVTKVLSEKHDKELERVFNTEQIIQILNIKILTGKLKDKEVKIKNYLTSNPEYDIKIKQGDRVIIEKDIEAEADEEYYDKKENDKNSKIDDDKEDETINITSKDNSPIILIASGLFLLLLLIIGGYSGLKTITTLGFSAILIIFGLLPAILANIHIIPIAIGVAVASVIFGIFIFNGFNMKSICAAISASLSLLLAGFLSFAVIYTSSITNIDSKEGLILLGEYPDMNFAGILTASVIISIIGVLTSVSIAIANYIAKKQFQNKEYGFKTLFKKGTEAGKKAIGTMVSALIFIYIGSALPLLILSLNIPLIKFINLGIVITEFSAAMIGSTAIILCSPITAAITAITLTKLAKPKN